MGMCVEHLKLRSIYEEAMRAWRLHHAHSLSYGAGSKVLRMRKHQLLGARLTAAEHVYSHTMSCPQCRPKIKSWALED